MSKVSDLNIIDGDILLGNKKSLTRSEIVKICNLFKYDYEKAINDVKLSQNNQEKEILFIFLNKWFTGLKKQNVLKSISIEKSRGCGRHNQYRYIVPAFKKKYLFGKEMLVDKSLTSILYMIAKKDEDFINSFFFRGVHLWEIGALLENDFTPTIKDSQVKEVVKSFEYGLVFDKYADIRKVIVFTMAANLAKKLLPYSRKNDLRHLSREHFSHGSVAF